MNTYSQSTGIWKDAAGNILAMGYSGSPIGKNNPADQAIPDVGPIPQGLWAIGESYDDLERGNPTIRLSPVDHDAFGRSDFLIHGDTTPPGFASKGCIILPRQAREQIAASADKGLQVVS